MSRQSCKHIAEYGGHFADLFFGDGIGRLEHEGVVDRRRDQKSALFEGREGLFKTVGAFKLDGAGQTGAANGLDTGTAGAQLFELFGHEGRDLFDMVQQAVFQELFEYGAGCC